MSVGGMMDDSEPLVDCVIEDDRWLAIGIETLARRAAEAALADLALPWEGFSVSLLACDDARIARLNAEFRSKPVATNVLSWPAEDLGPDHEGAVPDRPEPGDDDDRESLGDIAIAYDTCAAEAATAHKSLADHVSHLIVHGLLHCLGYDHVRDGDAELMEATEVRILASLGISDPY